MTTIHIRKHLNSDTLHLPELKPLIGKTVEIIAREARATAPGTSPYDAFFALAGQDVVAADAYKQLRAASVLRSSSLPA